MGTDRPSVVCTFPIDRSFAIDPDHRSELIAIAHRHTVLSSDARRSIRITQQPIVVVVASVMLLLWHRRNDERKQNVCGGRSSSDIGIAPGTTFLEPRNRLTFMRLRTSAYQVVMQDL